MLANFKINFRFLGSALFDICMISFVILLGMMFLPFIHNDRWIFGICLLSILTWYFGRVYLTLYVRKIFNKSQN